MNRIPLLVFFLLSTLVRAQEMFPPYWMIGETKQLQLILHQQDIGMADKWSSSEEKITIDSVYRPRNPNYLILYLNIAEIKEETSFQLFCRFQEKAVSFSYQLYTIPVKANTTLQESDVVYLFVSNLQKGIRNRDLRFGSNFDEMKNTLPLCRELGMTGIWIPLWDSLTQYHYPMTPHLTDSNALMVLCEEAKINGIKVLTNVDDLCFPTSHILVSDLIDEEWFQAQDTNWNFFPRWVNLENKHAQTYTQQYARWLSKKYGISIYSKSHSEDSTIHIPVATIKRLIKEHHSANSPHAELHTFQKDGKYALMRTFGQHGMLLIFSSNEEKTEFVLKDFDAFYNRTQDAEMKLSVQHVELNRYAIFFLEKDEVVLIEW